MREVLSYPLAIAFLLVSVANAIAQQAECQVTAQPPSMEQPGRSPAAVVTIGQHAVMVGDVGPRRAVIACNPDAGGVFREVGRWALPADYLVEHLEVRGSILHLRSTDGRTLDVEIAGAGAEKKSRQMTAVPVGGYGHDARQEGDATVLSVRGLSGSVKSVGSPLLSRVTPVGPGARISSRYVIGADLSRRQTIVMWDETGGGVRAFVGRFDASGALIAGARLPIEQSDTLPEHATGALSDGRVYYLEVKGERAKLKLLALESRFVDGIKPGGAIRRAIDEEINSLKSRLGGQRKSAAPETPEAVEASADAEFQAAVRALNKDVPSDAKAAAVPVKRADVAACAEAYRTHIWALTQGAYSKPNVPNECDPQAKYWRRPHYLNGQVGKKMVGIPYCWGCSHSIEQFDAWVSQGAMLAGHSCTCRNGHYCLRKDVAGVDCSGFVSQCWNSRYFTTSNMHQIADEIEIADMKRGDAFNRAGSHIMLFMSTSEGANGTLYRVIEATNREGARRVVETTFTAKQLKSYRPIRYRRIVD